MTTTIEQKRGEKPGMGSENPTVTVSTVECIMPETCKLRSDPPTDSELEVHAASGRFLVDIVNARDCELESSIDWQIRDTERGGSVDAGQFITYEMGVDEVETLDLDFYNCFGPADGHEDPDPKVPRVTIKLIKKNIG